MKHITLALSLMAISWSALSAPTLRGEDCRIGIDTTVCTRGLYNWGACTFGVISSGYWKPMKLASPTELRFTDAAAGVDVKAVLVGKYLNVNFKTPQGKWSKKILTKTSQYSSSLDGAAEQMFNPAPVENAKGKYYRISCGLGRTAWVEQDEARYQAEMDRLGLPGEWHNPSAPSLGKLAVGTVLTLKESIVWKEGDAIFEDHGLENDYDFLRTRTNYRFAFAQVFSSSNRSPEGTLPKGMKLVVTKVEVNPLNNGGNSFYIYFKTTTSGVQDPITRMVVWGRRQSFDVKIPQFKEILSPLFEMN